MKRDSFSIVGDRYTFEFQGETFYVFVVPSCEDGFDAIQIYMMQKDYSHITFIIGMEDKDYNKHWPSQEDKDEFIQNLFHSNVDIYLEDIEKLEQADI